MAPKKGLGKGLDSMIPKAIQEDKVVTQELEKLGDNKQETVVKISMVEPNRNQPRKTFDEEELQSLADSIIQHGLIQPILVVDRKDHYEIIAGERRWRAARMAGLKEIPVLIRDYTEQQIDEISLIENIQRQDLNAIEEAMAYKNMMVKHGLNQEEVAEKVSKNRSTIANALRLLKLSDKIQEMIINREISEGHARALLGLDDTEAQEKIAKKIVSDALSVRDVEKLVKNYGKPEKEKSKPNKELDVFYKDIAEKLKADLGTKVQISGKGDGTGKIEIEFYSNDELDRIIAMIK